MKNLKLACPCLFGIEGIVADEIRALGYTDVSASNGRVVFSGDENGAARANIGLRCAERVLILLGEFRAHSFEDLFQGVKKIAWDQFIGRDDEFPVKGWSLDSTLHSVPDCQAIIKKAVVERLKLSYRTDWFKENGPKHQIRFSILKDVVSIYLDTSGDGLHKRGYRENSLEAPLKETLAAALVKVARFYPDRSFFDPMCGSGTILIEAALIGLNIAPGINRRFASESWGCIGKGVFKNAREEARAAITKQPITVHGYDIDPDAVKLTLQNAAKAGVGEYVNASVLDIRGFNPPDAYGTVVTNPPYGERMLEIEQARELYKELGLAYSRIGGSFRFYVISPDEKFEEIFGSKADKRRKLYNGMIKCEYFQYFRKKQ